VLREHLRLVDRQLQPHELRARARAEGGGIGGGVSATEGGGPGYVTFYVAVDDPQATLDAIEAEGGHTVMPVTEIPGMVTLAQFQDPAGNMVGIIKS
jgi:predicted enzyme related to lactoylglutathione lyase